jgi:hypothetical protein
LLLYFITAGTAVKRVGLTKKKTLLSSQAATDLVQKLRGEYWEKVKNIAPENLVFLSGNGGFIPILEIVTTNGVNSNLTRAREKIWQGFVK